MQGIRPPVLAVLAAMLAFPGVASAKGSTLRFGEAEYAPGDQAVGGTEVETWRGSGQPEDGPYTVYLVPGRHPLWFGHLPADAIEVGDLEIGRLLASDTYRVRVSFAVPRVPDGRYAVWACGNRTGGPGCWLGFGDLVYGGIVVAREARESSVVVAAPAGVHGAIEDRDPGIPRRLIVVGLAVVILGSVFGLERRRRTAGM